MLKKRDNQVGVLLCFLIIVLVILFNFNSIFNFIFQNRSNNKNKNINDKVVENFETVTTSSNVDTSILNKCKLSQEDIKLTINSERRSVDVSFYSNTDCMNDSRFYGYDLVLAKYNSNLKNIGHLEVKVLGHIGNSLLAKLRNIKDPNDNKIFKNADFSDFGITVENVNYNKNTDDIKTLTNKKVLSKVNLERLLKILLEYKYHYDIETSGVGSAFDDTYNLISDFSNDNNFPKLSDIMKTEPTGTGGAISASVVTDLDDLDEMRRRLQIQVENLNLNKYSDFYTYMNSPNPTTSNNNDNSLLPEDRKFIVKSLLNYLINLKSQKNQFCNPHTNLCSYEFTNLEMKDDAGNDIFYKLGFRTLLSSTDNPNNKHYETKYITKDVPYFKLNEPIKMQREFLETAHLLKDMKNKPIVKKNVDEVKTKTDLENYMQQFLGNYPDELKLKQEEINEMSLSKYMNESLAQGEVNFNIGIDEDLNKKLNNQFGDAGVFDL